MRSRMSVADKEFGSFFVFTLVTLWLTSCVETPVSSTPPGGDIVVIGNGMEISWQSALVANATHGEDHATKSYLLADQGAISLSALAKGEDLATEEVSWVMPMNAASALVKVEESPDGALDKCSLVEATSRKMSCRSDFKISDTHAPEVIDASAYIFLDSAATLRRGPLSAESEIIAKDVSDFFVRRRAETLEVVFQLKSGDWFVESDQALSLVTKTEGSEIFHMKEALIKLESISTDGEPGNSKGTLVLKGLRQWTWAQYDFEKGEWARAWNLHLPELDRKSLMVRGDQIVARSADGFYALRHEGAFLLPMVTPVDFMTMDGVSGRLLIRAQEPAAEASSRVGQLCQYAKSLTQEGYHCRTLKTRDGDRVTTSLLTEEFLVIALQGKYASAGSTSSESAKIPGSQGQDSAGSAPVDASETSRVYNEVIALPSNHEDHQFAKIVKRWKVEGDSVESIRFFEN